MTSGAAFLFNSKYPLSESNHYYNPNPSLSDQMHCLVYVIPADKISLVGNDLIKKLKGVRETASRMDPAGLNHIKFNNFNECLEDFIISYMRVEALQCKKSCKDRITVDLEPILEHWTCVDVWQENTLDGMPVYSTVDWCPIQGIPQVVFMTRVDQACPVTKENLQNIYKSKKIRDKMRECSNVLGVPVNCIFPVLNYHEETHMNEDINCLMLDALTQIIHWANDYVITRSNNQISHQQPICE